jgi:3',5'-nucleoside bisphosphate phosphatase
MTTYRHVDLHAHTTASDGSATPAELVQAALDCGLDFLAVTDHDTVTGFAPTTAAAAGTSLRILPGIEVSSTHEGHTVHILGYGFDPTAELLTTRLSMLTAGREERARMIVSMLERMGAPVPWERVAELGKGAIGRPHLARVLVEQGHARDVANAFARFIGEGCPAYLPSGRIKPAEAIALVRGAGGETALAHSVLLDADVDLDALLDHLQEAGLSGLEVYHTEHKVADRERLLRVAKERGLWWCGGSDFHGPTKPAAILGAVDVPVEVLDQGPFPAALARLG